MWCKRIFLSILIIVCSASTFAEEALDTSAPWNNILVNGSWRQDIDTLYNDPFADTPLPKPKDIQQKQLSLSLTESILLALRNNPEVISNKLTRVTDKFALVVAHNQFEPQYSFKSNVNFNNGVKPTYGVTPGVGVKTSIGTQVDLGYSQDFLHGHAGDTTITVSQPLLRGAGWKITTIPWFDALDTEKVAKLTFKNSMMTAVVNVITAYRTLEQDYNNLSIQQRMLDHTGEMVKFEKIKYKAGKVAHSDLLQQQANYASTQLSMIQQKASLHQDYQNFLATLGLTADAKVVIKKKVNFDVVKAPNLQHCIQLALLNNVAYQSQLIQLNSTKRSLVKAKDENRWELNAKMTQSYPGTQGASDSSAYELDLDVPIHDMAKKQAIVNARIGLQQAKLALQQTKDQLVRTITSAVEQITDQIEQVTVGEESVELQKASFVAAKIKLKYGKTTVFEMNQLQDQYLQQQLSLVQDKVSLQNLVTALRQQLGITLEEWGLKLRY